MQPQELSALVSTLLMLVFVILPWTRNWFFDQPAEYQTAIKGAIAIVSGIAILLLTCSGVLPLEGIVCTSAGVWQFIVQVIIATVLGFAGASIISTPFQVRRLYVARARAKAGQ